ncbi:MAG: hypothetical protein ABIT76_14790 [Chthoniobacterales bacterium]
MQTPDLLDHTLQEWKVEPAIPQRFQADVWARIQQRENARASHWSSIWMRWLTPDFPVWPLATAATLVMMLLGAGIGSLSAASQLDRTRAELALEYVQSIDPYLHLASMDRK